MLRNIVDRMTKGYDWVVIDNEAGLEHLSRRTTRDVDVLLIVSDPTLRGITTAGRVVELISELKTHIGKHYLIVNRVTGDLTPELLAAIAEHKLNLVGTIPLGSPWWRSSTRWAGPWWSCRPTARCAAPCGRSTPGFCPSRGAAPAPTDQYELTAVDCVKGESKDADHRREHPHHLTAGQRGH